MFEQITKNSNGIDILIGCIFLRAVYIGFAKGIIVEFFKLMGMFFATFITLHYYARLTNFVQNYMVIPDAVGKVASAFLLCFLTVMLFKLIRDGWVLLIKGSVIVFVDKSLGIVLASLRAALIVGMVYVFLFLSSHTFLINQAQDSYCKKYFMLISVNVYEGCFENVVSKLFPSESKNLELRRLISKKPTKKTSAGKVPSGG